MHSLITLLPWGLILVGVVSAWLGYNAWKCVVLTFCAALLVIFLVHPSDFGAMELPSLIEVLLILVSVVMGLLAARTGRNGWKWGTLTFVVVLVSITLLVIWKPIYANRATIILPILIGIAAGRSKRKGWVWGAAAFVSAGAIVALFKHVGISQPVPRGAFSSFNALAVLIGCGAVALYLWWKVHKQQQISQASDEAFIGIITLIILTATVVLTVNPLHRQIALQAEPKTLDEAIERVKQEDEAAQRGKQDKAAQTRIQEDDPEKRELDKELQQILAEQERKSHEEEIDLRLMDQQRQLDQQQEQIRQMEIKSYYPQHDTYR